MKSVALTVTLALTLLGIALPAQAANTPPKTIRQVEYRNLSITPDLLLQTSDVINYQATAGYAPGCSIPTPSIETVKIWVSLGQTALLSGKNVTIYFTPCGSTNWITDVILMQ